MRGFVRTLFVALGLLGALIVTAAITTMLLIKDSGVVPEKLRAFVINEEDERWLSLRDEMSDEPAAIDPAEIEDEVDRNFRRLADKLNEGTVRELIENLSRREDELRERSLYLDQREAEVRLHKAELISLEQRFSDRRTDVQRLLEQLEDERESWAKAKLADQRHLTVLHDQERQRYKENAQRYALMKKPWELLRQLPDIEVAKMLTLMDAKKAAKILDAATKDPASRDKPIRIHRHLLSIDTDGLSQEQVARLAGLYNFMKADTVVDYLAASPAEEIARIIEAMDAKKGTALIEALHKIDRDRAAEVQRLLQQGPGAAVQ